ncbi:hypothetical protein Tco_0945283 [Tanacetum coccineum]
MFVEFVIQNQLFSFTLEEFGQILGFPYEGACSFSDKWSLDYLESSILTGGPYQTNRPSLDEIKLYIQEEREDVVTRIRHDKVIDDHVPACLRHMLYCISRSEQYNLAFFIAKQMEFVTKQAWLILPYGMLLTRLFKHLMSENPELSSDYYILYDHVMYPLTAQQERKTRKDYGTKKGRPSTFTSSSSAFDQPSSSHHIDDDNDGNDEGTSRASTPSPTCFVNSLSNDILQVFDSTMEPYYI